MNLTVIKLNYKEINCTLIGNLFIRPTHYIPIPLHIKFSNSYHEFPYERDDDSHLPPNPNKIWIFYLIWHLSNNLTLIWFLTSITSLLFTNLYITKWISWFESTSTLINKIKNKKSLRWLWLTCDLHACLYWHIKIRINYCFRS